METLLELKDVTKVIHKHRILQNVSLQVKPGEIVGLVGPNGAGKTSAMKIAAGFTYPTQGGAKVCGHDVHKERPAAMRESAFLIEEPGLYKSMTGRQHLKMVCEERDVAYDPAETEDIANLGKQIDDKVRTYSIGMKQRLGLAICWAMHPKLFVLDEPTNGLDPDGIFLLRSKIREAAAQGAGFLVSSHLLDELAKTADRILFIKKGELVWESAASDGDALEQAYREQFGGAAAEKS